MGFGKPQRDYPRAEAHCLREALIIITSHELFHLCVAEARGSLGVASETDNPDDMVLTRDMVNELSSWDLGRVYFRRFDVAGFSEERAANCFALGRLRAFRRGES